MILWQPLTTQDSFCELYIWDLLGSWGPRCRWTTIEQRMSWTRPFSYRQSSSWDLCHKIFKGFSHKKYYFYCFVRLVSICAYIFYTYLLFIPGWKWQPPWDAVSFEPRRALEWICCTSAEGELPSKLWLDADSTCILHCFPNHPPPIWRWKPQTLTSGDVSVNNWDRIR